MDTVEADRQIKQMIAFIRQEAKEKSEEIRQKTVEDKTIEKLSYKAKESKTIREEFEKMRKDKLTQKRIHRSTKINEARFTVMHKRNDLINSLKNETLAALCDVGRHKEYATFIRYLIVEGLTTIMEEKVEVLCRKCDQKIVEGEIKASREEYLKLVTRECGITPKCALSLSKTRFLPPPPSSENKGASCRGGISLSARNGKIVLKNTLESRLDLAFNDQKPIMRKMLFGTRPPPANAYRGS